MTMRLRANRLTGRLFWGCVQYPTCTCTRQYTAPAAKVLETDGGATVMTLAKLRACNKMELQAYGKMYGLADVDTLNCVQLREGIRKKLGETAKTAATPAEKTDLMQDFKNISKLKITEMMELAAKHNIATSHPDGTRMRRDEIYLALQDHKKGQQEKASDKGAAASSARSRTAPTERWCIATVSSLEESRVSEMDDEEWTFEKVKKELRSGPAY